MKEGTENAKNIAIITLCVTLIGCGLYLTHSFVGVAREVEHAAKEIKKVVIDNKQVLNLALKNICDSFEKFDQIIGPKKEINEMVEKGFTISGAVDVINAIVRDSKILISGYDEVMDPGEDATDEQKEKYNDYLEKKSKFNGFINMLSQFSEELKTMKNANLQLNEKDMTIYQKFLLYITQSAESIANFTSGKTSISYGSVFGGKLRIVRNEDGDAYLENDKNMFGKAVDVVFGRKKVTN